jgi:pyridinium-3,5-biscarboxylic acid mononucleotide sulfurtransferase
MARFDRSGTNVVLREKRSRLAALLRGYGSVCIGYSGGVDSAFLAVAALRDLGPKHVLAVTGLSAAYPRVQREQALASVQRFGIPHHELATDELTDPNYVANPTDRCYYCKTELWQKLRQVARRRGLAVVCDGSNADDAGDYRPGMRAGAQHGVHSPLLEAGLTKAEIRELARKLDLPTWNAPAAPCLSSRLPYGVTVTPERLRAVESAEDALRALGFEEFRVRHHGDAARIEASPAELPRALAEAETIVAACTAAGFARVLIDLDGYRRGSLNAGLPLVGIAPHRGTAPAATPPDAASEPAARLTWARSRLVAAGLDVSAEVTGHAADILAIVAPPSVAEPLRALTAELRSGGFRFIALDPRAGCAA